MKWKTPKKSPSEIASELSERLRSYFYRLKKVRFRKESVDKLCELFKKVMEDYIVKLDMQQLGFCNASLFSEGMTVQVQVSWSSIDLLEPVAKAMMAYQGRTITKEAISAVSGDYYSISKIDAYDASGMKPKSLQSTGVNLYLPRYYKVIKCPDHRYISLAMFYSEKILQSSHKLDVAFIVEKLMKYEELSDFVKEVFGIETYPDSLSKENVRCSEFISLAARTFDKYEVNKSLKAIMFYEPGLSSQPATHLIVLKNRVMARRKDAGHLTEIEARLIRNFSSFPKDKLMPIIQTVSLSDNWNVSDEPWDVKFLKEMVEY